MNTLIEQVNTEIAYRGYSARTGKSYCEHLRKLSRYINKPLELITDDELNAFSTSPQYVSCHGQARKYKSTVFGSCLRIFYIARLT